MEKYKTHAEMIRVIRMLQDRLDDNGLMDNATQARIDNAIYGFLAILPNKVSEEVKHG